MSGKNLPIYSISNIGYYFLTGQTNVSGAFNNISGFDIKIFKSESYATQSLSFSGISGAIPSGSNRYFSYLGDFESFDNSQPIFTSFYTNLGRIGVNFQILDVTTYSKLVMFNELYDYSFNQNNQISKTLTYNCYSGGAVSNFKTDLFFKLDYISGSGSFQVDNFASSAEFTSNAYGNILKSGILTGVVNLITGNSSVSGVYTISFDCFQWATGPVTGFFTGRGIGTSSGIGYTGRAHGFYTGLATGFINDGSGTLTLNQAQMIGISSGASYSIDYPKYFNATGYINISGLRKNDYFYIGVESTPIVKGLQYNDSTGLSYYLNNNSEHQVTSFSSGDVNYLESIFSGSIGNGIFIRNGLCNVGDSPNFSNSLTGGIDIGTTGNAVYFTQPFTGFIDLLMTGSGNYIQPVAGNKPGVFSFSRTFTGSWDLLTGTSESDLANVPKYSNVISGRAVFPANSSVLFQINHYDSYLTSDGALFSISGSGVINPISQIIYQ